MTPASDAAERRSALTRFISALVKLRLSIAAGSLASVLLLSYVLIALQVFGFAYYDLSKALAILEAASAGTLLLLIPASTLLPAIGYGVAVTLVCYVLSKLVGQIGGRGFFVYLAFPVLFLLAILIIARLPLLAGAMFLIVLLVLVTPFELIDKPQLADSYLKSVALAGRSVTDYWSLSSDAASAQQFEDSLGTVWNRRRVGVVYVGFLVVLSVSAVYARPWMPARVIELRKSVEALGVTDSCSDGVPTYSRVISGFVVGETSGKLTVLSLNRHCVWRIAPESIRREVVCRPERGWWARTPWELLTDSDEALGRCADTERSFQP
jgi:hypothetical protein